LAGSITNDKLSNNTVTIGTTTISLGGTTTSLSNVSSISYLGSSSGITTLQPSAVAGGTLTLSANTGSVISTGDTGTVTNSMLAGSITNNKLSNSSITIGTTNIALGSSNTSIRGIVNLGLANNINSANAVTLQVSESGGSNNIIIFPNQSGTVVLSGGTGSVGAITGIMIANNAIANVHISDTAAIATYKLAANTISGIFLGNNLASLANGSGLTIANSSYNGAKSETISVDSTVARNTSNLGYFSSTTSAQLAGVISDETGTGSLVFANTPLLITPNIGVATGTSLSLSGDLIVSSNLIVNGTTTTINSNEVNIDDKNFTLGGVVALSSITLLANSASNGILGVPGTTAGIIPGMTISKSSGTGAPGASAVILSIDSLYQITANVNNTLTGSFIGNIGGATDITATGGGLTLKGSTDKTFNWYNTSNAWTSSENVALATGKTIILNGSSSGTTVLQPSAVAGGTLTLSANTGAVISTGDTGTVTTSMVANSAITNAKLAGSITNDKLSNNSITIGTTNIALGSSNTTIKGVVNLGLANNINSANSVTLQVSESGGNNVIVFPNQSGTVVVSQAGAGVISIPAAGNTGNILTSNNGTWVSAAPFTSGKAIALAMVMGF
jgi:hypothetical protein